MNYLASPPLVIAYALAGTMDFDFEGQPLGTASDGTEVFLRDIWPSEARTCRRRSTTRSTRRCSPRTTPTCSRGDERWRSLPTPEGETFEWDPESTYVRKPPYFEGMEREPRPVEDIADARVLALLGDSVTTDHISPAGSIKEDTPAGQYLVEHGVDQARLQLLRLAARQPRGDDPRHVRQHPAAQPAPRQRQRRLHPRLHEGRRAAGVHLRRRAELRARGHAAGGARRQGVRLGLIARLGRQGDGAARGAVR